jgi:peptide/nickel transport system ATP-binding protein
MGDALLSVRDLVKHYPVTRGLLRREVGRVRAVDGVSFDLRRGETFGLVGESGCGKSTLATTLLRLEEPTGGRVYFDGEDVTAHDAAERRRFRRRTGMVFQDPESSFNPRMTAGESVAEPLEIHGMRDADRRRAIVVDLLERVGLSADDYDRYPHEFSGGQKQRLALARALVLNPDFLVLDEPVSALDVSVQATILDLLSDLQDEFDLAVLLVSHDMSVVREVCDHVGVMYLGELVERGPVEAIFEDPAHPYTRALLAAIPEPNPAARGDLVGLSGDVPDPAGPPAGCRFHTRCPEVIQPDEFDVPRETWRCVYDLRVDVARDDVTVDGDGPADLRADYGVPDPLPDDDVDAVLSAALDALARGDRDAADDRLAAFDTACRTDSPELREAAAGHAGACHRYRGDGGE